MSHQKEVLLSIGRLMEAGAWVIRGITFDGHFAHGYLKECLYGHFCKLNPADLESVPFWSKVSWTELPRHALPHLPLKICVYDDEPIWGLAGPCFLEVEFNLGGQVLREEEPE